MKFYWIILFELTLPNEKQNIYLFILEDHDICGVCEIQCDSPHNKINSKTKSMFIISVFVEFKRSNKKS